MVRETQDSVDLPVLAPADVSAREHKKVHPAPNILELKEALCAQAKHAGGFRVYKNPLNPRCPANLGNEQKSVHGPRQLPALSPALPQKPMRASSANETVPSG